MAEKIEPFSAALASSSRDLAKPETRRVGPVEGEALEKLRGTMLQFDRPTDPVADDTWELV